MKKVLSIILIVIILIILLANILSILEFSFFGFRMFRVASGSMEPEIPINSLIIIKKENDYHEGDIVTYHDSVSYTTHRIIKIDDVVVITKGDANEIDDDPITKESILGKVVFKISFIRFVTDLMKKPISWVVLFAAGMLILYKMPISKRLLRRKSRIDS